MKVLIFSVSAGGGHVHAAEAVKKYILMQSSASQVEIIDTIKYINPILDKVVIGSYLKSLKLSPAIFGKLYNFAETDDGLASISNKIIEVVVYRLIPLINKFEPDVIIATHAFSAEMLSVLKCKGKINIPTVTILTDYAPHSFWLHPGISAYIVSNSDMIDEMEKRGISRNIVFDLGIPVSPEFMCTCSREDTLKSIGLSSDKPTILLMGGSLGMGRITDVYNQIQLIDGDVQIIAIAGSNRKLYAKLMELQSESNKETRIIGYTKEVNKFMQASHLLVTKPGGLTITEALISKIPLAIFSAIPGQEEKNAEFLIKHNLAVNLGDGKNCRHIIEDILSQPSLLEEMSRKCSDYSKPNSGPDICKLLSNLIVNA